jgi:hypothetical protein
LKINRDILRTRFGPLHYEFRAHDNWGMYALNNLREYCHCLEFAGKADRVFHLAKLDMTPDENKEINQNWLPERFNVLLPKEAPHQDWFLEGDETGYLNFWHERSQHCLWVFGAIPELSQAPFQLPWRLILEDIIKKGGGIMHGGLIVQNGKGFILTAPPGGGKTTAISRLPLTWQVFSDDACLVWFEKNNMYYASPLPTWSVVLGKNKTLQNINNWEIGIVVSLSGIIFLQKGNQESMIQLPTLEGIPCIYRSLCEHPKVVKNRDLHHVHFVATARRLSKSVPNFILQATRDGQFWGLISTLI